MGPEDDNDENTSDNNSFDYSAEDVWGWSPESDSLTWISDDETRSSNSDD